MNSPDNTMPVLVAINEVGVGDAPRPTGRPPRPLDAAAG